jgi:serine/threonine protein kinase
MIFQRRLRIWRELHLLKSLPSHPNLIPLDRIVLDDPHSHILGITTPYVSGGTLEEDPQRVFRLSWLHQLTSVVDYLNLELGIVHQDIAARNILIDREPSGSGTERLRLFDFDYGARIGLSGCIPERNDVKGVTFTLYEIITRDHSYRMVPHSEQNPETVLNLEDWPVKRNLDSDISAYREHLNAWVKQRKATQDGPCKNESLADIPEMSQPSPVIMSIDEEGQPVYERSVVQMKRDALKYGNKIIAWDRAPDKGFTLL